LFSLIETKGKSKGNRTNLVNRLRIILIEDLFSWCSILSTYPLFVTWENERKNETSRTSLLNIVKILTCDKKIRLLSDLKIYAFRDEYKKLFGNKYDEIFAENVKISNDPKANFISLLKIKDPNCSYWYKNIDNNELWKILMKLANDEVNEVNENNEVDKNDEKNEVNEVSTVNNNLLLTLKTIRMIQSQLTKNHRESYLFDMCGISIYYFLKRLIGHKMIQVKQ
jgi:hypothetical protein